jgi:hypothetical protein
MMPFGASVVVIEVPVVVDVVLIGTAVVDLRVEALAGVVVVELIVMVALVVLLATAVVRASDVVDANSFLTLIELAPSFFAPCLKKLL